MDYNLAKKLKDAGFPYKDVPHRAVGTEINGKADFVFEPSFDELIEAFSNSEFFELSKLSDGWGCNDHYVACMDKTPKEAVANLWLELNKKI